MQYGLPFEGISRLTEMHRRLLAAFGPPRPTLRLDPVSQLVHSMLGARTRDAISRKTFAALTNRHSRWEELVELPYWDLFELIRGVTFAERKAEFIPLALRTIVKRRGRLDLDFLSTWPADTALQWLDDLPGVGPKTAAAVLNFSTLHQRALVVDTHYQRVAIRLGLIPEKTSLAKAARLLSREVPAAWNADDTETNFILVKQLGQECCRSGRTVCTQCPLCSLCPEIGRATARHPTATEPGHAHGPLS
jgi:endonuclease III